ncbi:ATP synthase F0 [Thelonectria olida]|uniref:ATP synthase F0 n=1 Tax=Thelonectria olida TaxID=1576542 RepID=A0A9P8WIB6_9HYPO|nr:ATP synthase F0 [Thelonectria olida]
MGWVLNATPEANSESQYPVIIAVCVVLSVLSVTVVSARLWVRYNARGLRSDDWWSAMSMAFALIYSALCITQTRYGLGLPLLSRPAENLVVYTRVNFAGRPWYQLGISFFKIALLISYLQLLQGTDHRTYRIVVWVSIVLIFLAHLGCTLSLIFACKPVHKSWNPKMDGTCLAPGPSFTGYAIITIVSDIVVALLPVPVLLKLEIRLKKKIGLIGIFALGLFTTLCSILRYLQIDRISTGDGNSTMLVLWGTIEFNVGNMVSSLPYLAPIFIRKAKHYRSKHSDEYNTPSRRGRSGGIKGSHYRLNDLSHDQDGGVITSGPKTRNDSEELILTSNGGIVKSLSYAVNVHDAPARSQLSTGISSDDSIRNNTT